MLDVKRMEAVLKKSVVIYLISALLIIFSCPQIGLAGYLTAVSDTMTRLKTGETSSHTIKFTLSTGNTFAAGETITIDFDEDGGKFTVAGSSSTTSDFNFNDGTQRTIFRVGSTPDCTGSSGSNDIAVGINDTTGVVTFLACPSYTASSSGATVTIKYGTAAGGTNRVTNPSSAATYVLNIAGTFGDTGSFAVPIISNDQVVVTATVGPTITFSLSANSTDFGTLTVGSVITASPNITLTISTNAENGYTITVRDTGDGTDPGLYKSSSPTDIIGSADRYFSDTANLNSVSVGYGIQASSTGPVTIAARYNQTGNTVGGLELSDTTLATFAGVPGDSHTITITHKAKISGFTPPGAYSDILTYIATANF